MDLQITDVRVLPGDSGFLLDDGTTAILYDSGFGFTGYALAENIRKILGTRPLDYIFLTHSHYDHALGASYVLQYWPQAKVVAGSYAAKIFSKPSAKETMVSLDRKFAAQNGITAYENRVNDLRVDIPVSDQDVIRAGDWEFIALELPGHTKCSVGYYCPALQLLLSCETIGVFNGEDDVVPSYLVGYEMTIRSIRRVSELPIKKILLPHYGVLEQPQAEQYLTRALQSAVSTKDAIVQRLQNGEDKETIMSYFKDRFYHGYIPKIYPVDAMELNTGITIDLLRRELS